MASASKAECAAVFINAREDIVVITTLEEMAHPQPSTPIQVDNATSDGIINCKVQKNAPSQWIFF